MITNSPDDNTRPSESPSTPPVDPITLEQQLAKLFTDSHTPWPEMKPIEWPDTFADKAMKLVDKYSQEIAIEKDTLIDDLINGLPHIDYPDITATNFMKGRVSGHNTAVNQIRTLLLQYKQGVRTVTQPHMFPKIAHELSQKMIDDDNVRLADSAKRPNHKQGGVK